MVYISYFNLALEYVEIVPHVIEVLFKFVLCVSSYYECLAVCFDNLQTVAINQSIYVMFVMFVF